mmetsp:Transcript_10483/g.18535  ORF Transcript_10483/g.18535 Transcript_10483/m.18535 type:complete len:217 (-) Transcript_10483:1165-1815(-)
MHRRTAPDMQTATDVVIASHALSMALPLRSSVCSDSAVSRIGSVILLSGMAKGSRQREMAGRNEPMSARIQALSKFQLSMASVFSRPMYCIRWALTRPETAEPKLVMPAISAKVRVSTPSGQTCEIRIIIGIKFIMKHVLMVALFPMRKTSSGMPRSLFTRENWIASEALATITSTWLTPITRRYVHPDMVRLNNHEPSRANPASIICMTVTKNQA